MSEPGKMMRPSGIPWVGQIPADWGIKPLTRCCVEGRSMNADGKETNVLSLSFGKIVRRDVESNSGLLPGSFETYQIVQPGHIVLRLTDLQNDQKSLRVGYVGERGIITSAYVSIVCGNELDGRYAYYLLHSYDVSKAFYAYGGGVRQSMRYDDFKSMGVLLPPRDLQRAIVDFLDRKTAAVDILIEKKEHLIALLAEKRSALIHRAITRGLNPKAPTKTSGVPWIGRIPAHWDVVRLKFVVSHTIDCHHSTPVYDEDAPYPALRTADVAPGRLDVPGARRVHEDEYIRRIARLKPMPRDIIYTREGERWGMAALVPDGVDLCLAQRVMLFRPRSLVSPGFLMWALNSAAIYHQLAVLVVGATSPHVNIGDIREVWVPLPPPDEQELVHEHVERATRQCDEQEAALRKSVDRLLEYRQSLITASVTGRLDIGAPSP